MMMQILRVNIECRADGGLHVTSDDIPGLVLSGKNRAGIIAGIVPAARAILEHHGEVVGDIRIDATFVDQQRTRET